MGDELSLGVTGLRISLRVQGGLDHDQLGFFGPMEDLVDDAPPKDNRADISLGVLYNHGKGPILVNCIRYDRGEGLDTAEESSNKKDPWT